MIRLIALSLALPAVALAGPPTTQPATGSSSDRPSHDALRHVETQGDSTRIINGVAATKDDFPETGMLVLDAEITFGSSPFEIRSPICSSTLIAPDVVLLAAHCLDPTSLTFGLGEVERADWYWSRETDLSGMVQEEGQPLPELPADRIAASDVVVHPDFDLEALDYGLAENGDIALMFLAEPVFDVDHAYLATADEVAQIRVDSEVTVVGWGQSEATGQFETPPDGTIYIKNQGVTHISELNAFEMKIGELETDVRKCHGDSGGPTFLEMEDQDQPFTRRIIGVTSHAYDETDCFETGGADTRVDHYIAWIDNEMRIRCEDGTRSWCGDDADPADYSSLTPPTWDDLEDGTKNGCGCSAAPAPGMMGGWALGLLALVGLRRRTPVA